MVILSGYIFFQKKDVNVTLYQFGLIIVYVLLIIFIKKISFRLKKMLNADKILIKVSKGSKQSVKGPKQSVKM